MGHAGRQGGLTPSRNASECEISRWRTVVTPSRVIILVIFLCTIVWSTARSNSFPAAQNVQEQNDQNQALRDDLAKMKSLVQQMDQNLAFVDTTQSPLKHQFQLEIDMWKTTINQMERRIEHGSRGK